MKKSRFLKYTSPTYPLLFLIILVFGITLIGADSTTLLLKDNQIPGLQIKETQTYADKELYGYIDGGAEIYREFGFVILSVQFLEYEKNDLVLEIYQMNNVKAAFGIYSVSSRNCPALEALTRWSCKNPYQISFTRGPFYITITNYHGTPEMEKISQQIAKSILGKISEPDFRVPQLIDQPAFLPFIRQLKFIAGPLGVQNAYPEWSKYFDPISSFSGFILPMEKGSDRAIFSKISFVHQDDFRKFYRAIGFSALDSRNSWQLKSNQDGTIWLKPLDQQNVFIIQASESFPEFDKLKELIDKKISATNGNNQTK
jgi:hypothetical protein